MSDREINLKDIASIFYDNALAHKQNPIPADAIKIAKGFDPSNSKLSLRPLPSLSLLITSTKEVGTTGKQYNGIVIDLQRSYLEEEEDGGRLARKFAQANSVSIPTYRVIKMTPTRLAEFKASLDQKGVPASSGLRKRTNDEVEMPEAAVDISIGDAVSFALFNSQDGSKSSTLYDPISNMPVGVWGTIGLRGCFYTQNLKKANAAAAAPNAPLALPAPVSNELAVVEKQPEQEQPKQAAEVWDTYFKYEQVFQVARTNPRIDFVISNLAYTLRVPRIPKEYQVICVPINPTSLPSPEVVAELTRDFGKTEISLFDGMQIEFQEGKSILKKAALDNLMEKDVGGKKVKFIAAKGVINGAYVFTTERKPSERFLVSVNIREPKDFIKDMPHYPLRVFGIQDNDQWIYMAPILLTKSVGFFTLTLGKDSSNCLNEDVKHDSLRAVVGNIISVRIDWHKTLEAVGFKIRVSCLESFRKNVLLVDENASTGSIEPRPGNVIEIRNGQDFGRSGLANCTVYFVPAEGKEAICTANDSILPDAEGYYDKLIATGNNGNSNWIKKYGVEDDGDTRHGFAIYAIQNEAVAPAPPALPPALPAPVQAAPQAPASGYLSSDKPKKGRKAQEDSHGAKKRRGTEE